MPSQKKKTAFSDSFKNVINKMCLQIIYTQYMYKQIWAINNLQWLICHKTQSNQIINIFDKYVQRGFGIK